MKNLEKKQSELGKELTRLMRAEAFEQKTAISTESKANLRIILESIEKHYSAQKAKIEKLLLDNQKEISRIRGQK